MANRVRVRRDRPSALTWAVALAVTMLAVYLITLSAPVLREEDSEEASSDRVTREITFEGVAACFAALGQYEDAAQARIAAAGLAQRGAAGCVYAGDSGFCVLAACYDAPADAERIAGQLGEQESLEASVVALSAEAISMRITAPSGDVDRIEEADRVLRAQLAQAGATALQVDRGELSLASARTLAAVSRSELRAALGELKKVAGAAENPVCSGLMELLDALAEALGEIARSSDASAALSGRLRCCHVDGTLRLIGFLNGLSG